MLLQRNTPSNRDRVKPTRETPVRILSAVKAITVLTIVFDQPVILKGTPAYTTDLPAITPVNGGAVLINPTTLELTFSADITLATSLTVEFEDQAIRSAIGGFVADSTFAL